MKQKGFRERGASLYLFTTGVARYEELQLGRTMLLLHNWIVPCIRAFMHDHPDDKLLRMSDVYMLVHFRRKMDELVTP